VIYEQAQFSIHLWHTRTRKNMKTNLPHCVVITGLLLSLLPSFGNAQNLVSNSDFNAFTAWNTSCSIEVNPESVYGGTSATNNVTEIDMERCFNQHICVLAGTSYTLSFKGSRRTAGATPANPGITIKVTGDNTGTQYVSVNKAYNNSTFAFTTQTYSFTVPAGSADKKVNISFSAHANNTTYGVILDDIEMAPTSAFSISGSASPTMNVNSAYATLNTPASGVNYSWDFIDHASPLTSTAATPSVQWSTTGNRNISVALSNGNCTVTTLNKAVAVTSLLPVKLTGFTARNNNDEAVLLNWTTQQEQNNRYFIVQRSADGITFDSIGVVTGTNTAIAHTYAFTDKHPFNGSNYYRLKQVDYDHAFEHTIVVTAVIRGSEATIQLYPNPTHNLLNCNFTVSRGGLVKIQVANTAGMVVLQQETNYSAGSHRATVPVQSLQRGTYYLKMSDSNGMQLVKAFSVL